MMKNSAVSICLMLFGAVCVFKSGNQLQWSLSVITLTPREHDHVHKELSPISIWPACCGTFWVYLFMKEIRHALNVYGMD